jgi:LmbE family N-acetylglucosaminyl deacetylase
VIDMAHVLGIGAHPDDLELGCAGTLARHIAQGDRVTMLVVTEGQEGPGDASRRKDEARHAARAIGADLVFGGLPDGSVSNHEFTLVHLIEDVLRSTGATTVYTHGQKDSHQDHRAVGLASMGACRQVQRVLCYDSPSSIGFSPSIFVDITTTLDKKLTALGMHESQVENSSMASLSLVATQAGYRGFQARCEAAEGFEPLRLVLSMDYD